MAAQEGQIPHTATNHSNSFNYLPTTTTNLLLLAFCSCSCSGHHEKCAIPLSHMLE